MDENQIIITTPQELKKYIGKLVVTHYGGVYSNFEESLRVLHSIKDRDGNELKESNTSLNYCHVYGQFILRRKNSDKTFESYFCTTTRPLYSDNVDYVRLPTTEEKHEFMERLTKYNLENNVMHIG